MKKTVLIYASIIFASFIVLYVIQNKSSQEETIYEDISVVNSTENTNEVHVHEAVCCELDSEQLQTGGSELVGILDNEVFEDIHQRIYEFEDDLKNRQNIMSQIDDASGRYDNYKGEPHIVYGIIGGGITAYDKPLKMSLCDSDGVRVDGVVVGESRRFAFPEVKPGNYTLFLLESAQTPGVRVADINVNEGKAVPEITISDDSSSVMLNVKDMAGNPIEGAQITIGKQRGGSNENVYTFKTGYTNSAGYFKAANLVDGRYVAVAKVDQESASKVFMLESGKEEMVQLNIALKGASVTGIVQNTGQLGLAGLDVVLIGIREDDVEVFKAERTNASGEFFFNAVQEGTYSLNIINSDNYGGFSDFLKVDSLDSSYNDIQVIAYQTDECGKILFDVPESIIPDEACFFVVKVAQAKGFIEYKFVENTQSSFEVSGLPPYNYFVDLTVVVGDEAVNVFESDVKVMPGKTTKFNFDTVSSD